MSNAIVPSRACMYPPCLSCCVSCSVVPHVTVDFDGPAPDAVVLTPLYCAENNVIRAPLHIWTFQPATTANVAFAARMLAKCCYKCTDNFLLRRENSLSQPRRYFTDALQCCGQPFDPCGTSRLLPS